MIQYTRHQLANGLRILLHPDPSTPLVNICLTYYVGTRDEDPSRTGFAHLFEHLMFGGSKNAPNFDDLVQMAGGENNAFTNQDMTVYYETLPAENLAVGLWLEADRMANLLLNKKALATQRKVVVEEFKETCLGQPYGDIWHHLGDLAYKVHPYKVPTIGLTFDHIEQASLGDVQAFFQRFYRPNNAVLVLAGSFDNQEALQLIEQYFGGIEAGPSLAHSFPQEPTQETRREADVYAKVPLSAIYLLFPCAGRLQADYYADDLLSDILGEGDASRLYQKLVKEKTLFTELDAYITGTIDPGLFVIEGKLSEDTTFEQAEQAIWEELRQLSEQALSEREWQKMLNRVEHSLAFGETSAMNKAINLGFYETIGHAEWINEEAEHYRALSPDRLRRRAADLFQAQRCSVLRYHRQ